MSYVKVLNDFNRLDFDSWAFSFFFISRYASVKDHVNVADTINVKSYLHCLLKQGLLL